MPEVTFSGLLLVAVIAFLAPLLIGLAPRLRLPAVVLEIVAGIAVGPAGLGWVTPDDLIEVLALLGLAMLLFLAGLEIDPTRLRGRLLRVPAAGFALSFAVALAAGAVLAAAGVVSSPLFVAIVLTATSLGLVIPVLKDAGESGSELGQLTIAGSSIADFAAVILLSLFF
jgi:Kef-type K+ transport system membrane component KefB